MKLRTVTLGCKVNQYETEYVREALLGVGWRDALDGEPADLCVVNTCTVTAEGDAKSRRAIRRLARENPDARILVMGCYATRAPEEVAALPNVTEIVTDKRRLPDLLSRWGVSEPPAGVRGLAGRHRAYVKVQDGCILDCSYCIIPHVRPVLNSRPIDQVVDEVRQLVAKGYREVVLTGIHLGHYGLTGPATDRAASTRRTHPTLLLRDRDGRTPASPRRLAGLVRAIVALPGDFRVRLSSLEATEVTRDLLAVMADYGDKVCPHLHLSMQSGAETVLRRMRRRWGAKRFVDRCLQVRDALDQPAITTDVMVGFPGESDTEFEETVAACRVIGFSKIHIFPFSPRAGTPAATMADQVPAAVKKERLHALDAVGAELRDTYFRSLLGRQLRVLVEGIRYRPAVQPAPSNAGHRAPADTSQCVESDPYYLGTACRYAPVEIGPEHRPAPQVGQFADVRAQKVTAGHIR